MNNFHDELLPVNYKTKYEPSIVFDTSIIRTYKGLEYRYPKRRYARFYYSLSYIKSFGDENDDIANNNTIKALANFWAARKGALYCFRFKDFFDYDMSRSTIGAGNGTKKVFRIYKPYTILTETYNRPLFYTSSETVWVNSVEQSSGYSISMGKITFDSAPANGHEIEVECSFDVIVRFADRPEIKKIGPEAGEIQVKLIEVFDYDTPVTTTETFNDLIPNYWAGTGE